MTEYFYVYCDSRGKPVGSTQMGKISLFPSKPTKAHIAVQRYQTDGKITQVKTFKLVEVE